MRLARYVRPRRSFCVAPPAVRHPLLDPGLARAPQVRPSGFIDAVDNFQIKGVKGSFERVPWPPTVTPILLRYQHSRCASQDSRCASQKPAAAACAKAYDDVKGAPLFGPQLAEMVSDDYCRGRADLFPCLTSAALTATGEFFGRGRFGGGKKPRRARGYTRGLSGSLWGEPMSGGGKTPPPGAWHENN